MPQNGAGYVTSVMTYQRQQFHVYRRILNIYDACWWSGVNLQLGRLWDFEERRNKLRNCIVCESPFEGKTYGFCHKCSQALSEEEIKGARERYRISKKAIPRNLRCVKCNEKLVWKEKDGLCKKCKI